MNNEYIEKSKIVDTIYNYIMENPTGIAIQSFSKLVNKINTNILKSEDNMKFLKFIKYYTYNYIISTLSKNITYKLNPSNNFPIYVTLPLTNKILKIEEPYYWNEKVDSILYYKNLLSGCENVKIIYQNEYLNVGIDKINDALTYIDDNIA